MKYLKLFQNHSNYNDFISGGTMLKPNVSHCVTQKEVHYNPREAIVRGTIRTSDFNKIVYGNENGSAQSVYTKIAGSTTPSQTCQFSTSSYYYKNFVLTQRENGANVPPQSIEYYLFVTYSIDEYEMVKRTSGQMTVLLAQDGSLVSAATYANYSLDEWTTLPYLDENGECIIDENTDECMVYNGKYDVHVSYAVNLINPNVNAVSSKYRLYQDDGIQLPSSIKPYFNEDDFLDSIYNYSLWLDMDGTVRGVKLNGEVIKNGDNYVTENVIPRFNENGDEMYDDQDNPIYYNGKYTIKTPLDDVPFSAIRIDGEEVDLNKLVLGDMGFYELEEGEYSIEYVLKNRREIPSYAFNSCVALEDVKIPNKVKKIDIDAFSNCPLLGTDENTIMRICSIDSEPIVVEATFDFGENEQKVLQKYIKGIFYPVSSDTVDEIEMSNYYVINNGVVADVDCVLLSGGDIK